MPYRLCRGFRLPDRFISPAWREIPTEELVLLQRIRRLSRSFLMYTDDDRDRCRRDLEAAHAEYFQRFEQNADAYVRPA